MKILVPIKRVVDYNIKVCLKSNKSDLDLEHIKMSINPFDEIAIEQAVSLSKLHKINEIILISIGPKESLDIIKHGLAMGANRGVLIESNRYIEPLSVAKIIRNFIIKENIDITLLGKQSIDDDCNQTGQMLAGLLNCSQATNISYIKIIKNNSIIVKRDNGYALQSLILTIPTVITVDYNLIEPHYVSLLDIIQAQNKKIDFYSINNCNIVTTNRLIVKKLEEPIKKNKCKIFNSVTELINEIKYKKHVS